MITETLETTAQQKAHRKPAKATVEISGSEAVLKAFVAEGVETIFGYPGGAIMPIYDALYDYQDTTATYIWCATSRAPFMQPRVMHALPVKQVWCLPPAARALLI